ncbi:MAG: hypothetical protein DRP90_00130 [Planctomycetota bacterium]|nr:MAG: hypothetical protein DRP90_00130 [Planctomycetota bacterium]
MFARQRTLIGLDIGSAVVKAVELSLDKETITLTGYGSAPVAGADNVEHAIREALNKGKIHSKRVATSVSGRKVVVRYFPVESGLNPQQLDEVVRNKAPDFVPFNLDEVEMDYYPVTLPEPTGDLASKVVLVAAKTEEIENRVRVLRSAGLVPDLIDIDTFALSNAFELWAANNGISITKKIIALVDIGFIKTTIGILHTGVSNFSREVYIGTNDMRQAIAKRFSFQDAEAESLLVNPGDSYDAVRDAIQNVLEDIGNEIRLSIDFYENQFETEVNEIYVSGGVTRFPDLVEILGQIFFLPTNQWNPAQGMNVAPGVDEEALFREAAQLPIAVGLASRLRKKV